jgi:hypothetical protein
MWEENSLVLVATMYVTQPKIYFIRKSVFGEVVFSDSA